MATMILRFADKPGWIGVPSCLYSARVSGPVNKELAVRAAELSVIGHRLGTQHVSKKTTAKLLVIGSGRADDVISESIMDPNRS
ncbi:hypothetical protein NEUTE2DRAFT_67487 [Neurospora tetrasperma FGSC 2509]|nr:hypothetical protein NEUTE2DRAFT_67487 [Neurospora tetrasperma FGSC 2509]